MSEYFNSKGINFGIPWYMRLILLFVKAYRIKTSDGHLKVKAFRGSLYIIEEVSNK